MSKLPFAFSIALILASPLTACDSAPGEEPDARAMDAGEGEPTADADTPDAGVSRDGGLDGNVPDLDAAVIEDPDAGAPAALRCVGSYGTSPPIVFRADGTVTLVTGGTYEYLDADTVRLTSSSWDPSTLEGTFSADCSTFMLAGGGGTLARTAGGRCGDGMVDDAFGEICDDGNRLACEGGCSAECLVVVTGCGDGVVCGLEECDDGGAPEACFADCTVNRCGDGTRQAGEACDDGNRASGDGCRRDCFGLEVCGDGLVDVLERCDDANALAGDGCSETCAPEPGCRCAVAGAACTNAFENTPSSGYQIIERIVGGETWALGYRSGSGVGDHSSVGYPVASFELRPVPAESGTYALITGGRTLYVYSGLGGSLRPDALPESSHGTSAREDHWRLRYVGTDAVGDRFSIQTVVDDQYLCWEHGQWRPDPLGVADHDRVLVGGAWVGADRCVRLASHLRRRAARRRRGV